MKYTGYIVLKFYDRDTLPVDTEKRLWETIFLKLEYDIKQEDKTYRPDILPIYTSLKDAEADSEWWSGHTADDYSVIKKVTVTIEDTIHNTRDNEIKYYETKVKENPEDNYFKKELNSWKWE